MPQMKQAKVDMDQQVTALANALRREYLHYEQLVTMAAEQGRLMTGTDLEAVGNSASAMADGLAVGDSLRHVRENLALEIMALDPMQPTRLSLWLQAQPDVIRERLAGPLARVREAGQKLLVQNEKNRRLASFCLDLVEEEAKVLRRSLTEDPAGCYDRGANHATDGTGCMLHKKA